jgi:LPXTG-motif cell wall-anchored protein
MKSSFINQLIELLKPLFNDWGYLIVLAGAFLESIFITGWVAPGTAVLLLGAFYAAHGELNFACVLSVAVVGAILGDNISYFIGCRVGRRLTGKYEKHPRLLRGLKASEHYFDRYGPVTVLLGRMVSGVDAFIPVTAGMSDMPYWKYILFDIPGAIIWVAAIGTLGYLFGNNWERIEDIINWFGWGMLGMVLLAAGSFYLLRRRRKNRSALNAASDDP